MNEKKGRQVEENYKVKEEVSASAEIVHFLRHLAGVCNYLMMLGHKKHQEEDEKEDSFDLN